MKKKILIIVVFHIFLVNIFSQSFNVLERIQNGDTSLCSEKITDIELAKLNNSELRLLRNMVYAKYGHIFQSEDLQAFYSNFKWYKPSKKVLDSQLSKAELDLVERCTVFERRKETEPALKFGKEITGIWHASPIMPDTWLDRFVIEPDNKIAFLLDYFQENPEVSEYLGHYEIKGNTLLFYVDELLKGDKKCEPAEGLILKFPITAVYEVSFMNGELIRQAIKIGSHEYYLFQGDPRRGQNWRK